MQRLNSISVGVLSEQRLFFKITKKRKVGQIQTVTFLPVFISESTDFEIQGLCIQYTRASKLGIQYLSPEIK